MEIDKSLTNSLDAANAVQLDEVAGYINKNDRFSWDRKYKKLNNIIKTELDPINEKILNLNLQKEEILVEVETLRKLMVSECVHHKDFLIAVNDHILCTFCNKKLKINPLYEE